jgi:outer membrane protein OmpA-like peptidoglycan-associated protein
MKIKLIACLLITSLIQQKVAGQTATYSVAKALFSSDKYDEFSPVYYKNGIVFTTNRPSFKLSNYSSEQDKGPLKIYYIDTTGGVKWENAKLFSKDLKTKLNDGPVTFNPKADTIFFSRNLEVEGKLADLSTVRNKLGIFYAVLVNGEWTKVHDLRINNGGYNVTTPCLSPDGKKLYFASDKPGGFGGLDLYYCQWKNDHWDNPVNLGPEINTPGNEAYPFVNREGGIFFSSDGHLGLGGKDIFYSKPSGSSWLPPVDLDPPINSQFDDFSLISDSVMNEGYFSSKRDNTTDIYHFKTNFHQLFYCENQRTNQYCFKFSDEGKILINKEYLNYIWSFGDGSQVTGQNVEHCFPGPGKYSVKLDVVDKKSGRIFFSKLSYNLELKEIEQPIIKCSTSALVGESVSFDGLGSNFPGSKVLNFTWYFGDGDRTTGHIVSHSFRKKGEYEIKLGLILQEEKTGKIFEACTSNQIKVFDNNQEKTAFESQPLKPIPVISITEYDHAFIGNMYSAEKGFNQDVVFDVEILTSKTRLALDNAVYKDVPKKYSIKEIKLPSDNLFHYIIDEEMSLMAAYSTFNDIINHGYGETKIRTLVLEDPAAKELNNLKRVFGVSADVFFMSNSFILSSKGTQVLDQIIGFMAKFPGIKLEIATHTDNTDSENASLLLSQKRAESMVNYLIKNGVNSLRLISKGYGGSKPLVPNFLETDRKLNRRVDFTIIK